MIQPTPTTREAWLAERRTLLTASDVPAALGLSPWKSPFELWAEKTGNIDPEDIGDRDAVKWGLRLEGSVIEGYAEDTGRICSRWPQHTLKRSESIDWLGATPDAIQNAPEFGDVTGNLQIKTTNAFKKADWAEEPPIYYQVQLQTELLVTGMPWGTLAALIGGQQLVWFDQELNQRFVDAMLPKLEAFWELVKTGTPPPVDGSEATARILAKLYATDNGQEVFLTDPDLCQAATDLAGAKEKIKELEALETAAKNKLVAAIGEASFAVLPDGRKFSHKQQTRKEYVCKASTFRVLRAVK